MNILNIPNNKLLLIPAVITVTLMLVIFFLLRRSIRKNIKETVDQWNRETEIPEIKYSLFILNLFTAYIEKLSITFGINLPVILHMDDAWIDKLQKKNSRKAAARILKYSADRGLYTVMKASLRNRRIEKLFTEWTDKSGEFMLLRKIALSGNGEDFDGKAALELFRDRTEELIEMTGDFEWKSRYFAVMLLIHDQSQRGINVVWDSFEDPESLVRITVINNFIHDNRKKLYSSIENILLNDPSFEARKAARKRIISDFLDLYKVNPKSLSVSQQLHLIELLDQESKQDENIAVQFIKSGNRELELYAARFLSESGALKRLFLTADPGYADSFEDAYRILKIAVGVSCTSFIDLSGNEPPFGALLIASRILLSDGNRDLISDLLKVVFSISRNRENIHPYREVYENSIKCACSRGSDKAMHMLNSEIQRRRYDKTFQDWILELIPPDRDNIFAPNLLSFLEDPDYPSPEALRAILVKMPVSSVLPEIITVIKSNPSDYTRQIRMDSLKIMGAMKLPHCTQYIFENLKVLPLDEAKEYSKLLKENSGAAFRTKVKEILASSDAETRAHMIAALPDSERKTFLAEIKDALKDSNPEVRIAAGWSLLDYNKGELLPLCYNLLRDPVEHVRTEAGRSLASITDSTTSNELKQTLFDRNESNPVKAAVLYGLSVSESAESVDMILDKLEENYELADECITALSRKTGKENLIRILEYMNGTTPSIADKIIKSVKLMGDAAETVIEELLFSDSRILHAQAVAVLEGSGIIDYRIRQLNHRNPEVRKKASEFLVRAGTKSAFRGIILAAKDPVEDVRVQVVKALDKMNTPEGLPMLEELKNDPEKRVRKYTLWALERYEAKNLI